MTQVADTAETAAPPRGRRRPVPDVGAARQWWARATTEAGLSCFWEAYVEECQRGPGHVLRHPVATAAAVVAIGRLPRRTALLPDTAEGRVVHRTLTRPGLLRTPFGSTGVSVLDVPADAAEYSLGASRQTLRRKARAATRAGVTWRLVRDPEERRELLALGNRVEAEHADETYRNTRPDNTDLLDVDLWLVAHGPDGTPLLLSVTPTEGEWAQLRYFRILGNGRVHSDTRYLVTQALVETLSGRGVRHLFEGTHPAELPNGLRHFQRMVGFRSARVRSSLAPR